MCLRFRRIANEHPNVSKKKIQVYYQNTGFAFATWVYSSCQKPSAVASERRSGVQAFSIFPRKQTGNKNAHLLRKTHVIFRRGRRLGLFGSREGERTDPPLVIVFGNLTHFFFSRLFAPTACGWGRGMVKTKIVSG